MDKKSNGIVSGIAISIASVLLLFVIIEVILRLVNYNPIGRLTDDERAIFIRPSANPARIYEATPNTTGRGWGTEISINSHGFRGNEYAVEKPPGIFRIVVIGDSIAFGNGLVAGTEFPAVLEKQYREAGQAVEVLNLALGGYDTLQEIATLEDIGLKFKPDLVILAYCINDIGVASGNAHYIESLKKYQSPLYKLRTAQLIQIQIDRIMMIRYTEKANDKQQFYITYRDQLADISDDSELAARQDHLQRILASSPAKYPFTYDYTDAVHVQRLRFSLQKLHALQQASGFRAMAVMTPYLLEDEISQPAYEAVYGIVAHEFERLGIPLIDFYSPFKKAGLSSLLNKKNDGVHPNASGHEIIAKEIYRTISTR